MKSKEPQMHMPEGFEAEVETQNAGSNMYIAVALGILVLTVALIAAYWQFYVKEFEQPHVTTEPVPEKIDNGLTSEEKNVLLEMLANSPEAIPDEDARNEIIQNLQSAKKDFPGRAIETPSTDEPSYDEASSVDEDAFIPAPLPPEPPSSFE